MVAGTTPRDAAPTQDRPTIPGWCEQPQQPDTVETPGVRFRPSPNPLDHQVGGDHYHQIPREYQPIVIADKLQLTPAEYNCLKRLLRHRSKGGAADLRKAIHDLELLIELEYGESDET